MKAFLMILTSLLPGGIFQSMAQQRATDLTFQAGASLINLRGNEIVNKQLPQIIVPTGGIGIEQHFSRVLSLHTRLLLDPKGGGAKYTFTDQQGNPNADGWYRLELIYLTIPVQMQVYFGKEKPFFVQAGPYFSKLLRAREINDAVSYMMQNAMISYFSYDLGWSAGAGMKMMLKNRSGLLLNVRFARGLTNISRQPIINDGKILNSTLSFTAGYVFQAREK